MCHSDTSPNPGLKISPVDWSLDFSRERGGHGGCEGQSSSRLRPSRSISPAGAEPGNIGEGPPGRVGITLGLSWAGWAWGWGPPGGKLSLPRPLGPLLTLCLKDQARQVSLSWPSQADVGGRAPLCHLDLATPSSSVPSPLWPSFSRVAPIPEPGGWQMGEKKGQHRVGPSLDSSPGSYQLVGFPRG